MNDTKTRRSGALYRPKRFYRDMTAEKAQAIRKSYFETRCKQKDLAVQFGVSPSTVSLIISGKVW
jgi:uncharacterized protein YjcR